MTPPQSRRFAIAAAALLLINLGMLLILGHGADDNAFWIVLNLPGLPCGIGVVILGASKAASLEWLSYLSLIVTSVVSSLLWAALISRVTFRRSRNE